MSIVVNPANRPDAWMVALGNELPDEDLYLWPRVSQPGDVEFVLAWSMEADDLARFPNLEAVFSLGAGVDQWLGLALDRRFVGVDVVRLVDPAMSDEMAAYALYWVLHYQRGFDQVAALRQQRQFRPVRAVEAHRFPVGILGHGTIGRRVGRAFTDLGYPVNAWTRTAESSRPTDDGPAHDRMTHDRPAFDRPAGDGVGPTPAVSHHVGLGQLDTVLAASRAVINVLPNTADTVGLLTGDRLARFTEGAVFVNMGRGTVVAEADLLRALDQGPLRAAVLDVTDPEPPEPSSPLFDHPGVVLTGHMAGFTHVPSAARIIADNIRRLRRGEEAFPLLDPERGY